MICRKCGGTRLRRSHTRGFKEKFLKSRGFRAFRCQESDCDWRGLIKFESLVDSDGIRQQVKNIFTISLFVILTLSLTFLVIACLD